MKSQAPWRRIVKIDLVNFAYILTLECGHKKPFKGYKFQVPKRSRCSECHKQV